MQYPQKNRLTLLATLLFLGACNWNGAEETGFHQLKVPLHHWFYDADLKMILINASPAILDSIQGSTNICGDFCVQIEADKGIARQKGIAYFYQKGEETGQLFWTQLPVLNFTVENQIPDEPRIPGVFRLTTASGVQIESSMGIETRGRTTLQYPKKSFRIELTNDLSLQEERKIALLGMQKDGDWNLLAMYNEPLRINNMTASKVWADMGYAGPVFEYVELFLNKAYQGLYILTRRVDSKLLDIDDNGELYKGNDWMLTSYDTIFPFDNTQKTWGGFEYLSPSPTDWKPLYDWLYFAVKSDKKTLFQEYGLWIDSLNIADYFHFLNMLKMADNTNKNIYLAKSHESSLYFFSPWDMDGSFGNYWDGSFHDITSGIHSNGLYERLLEDESPQGFSDLLRNRWKQLRKEALSLSNLKESLRAEHRFLKTNGVYARESAAWSGSLDSSLDRSLYWLERRWNYWNSFMESPSLFDQYLKDQVWE